MAMKNNKIQIRNKETIKPSSPTPPNLKTLKLSVMDQFTPITYTSLLLFYPLNKNKNKNNIFQSNSEILQKLKSSLSETLTHHFYPLAGRLKDNSFIECNDEGAEFVEARAVDFSLTDILEKPDTEFLKQFLPAAIESPDSATGNLLLVQVTFFECGSFSIGICVSHKLADAATLTTFINCWSSMADMSEKEVVSPFFMGDSLFPQLDISVPNASMEIFELADCITRRLVFSESKISALKAKVDGTKVPNPTRFEAVSGLLWKAVITAKKSRLGFPRTSVWFSAVNLRPRLVPQLPENYSGNCVGSIAPRQDIASDDIDLVELVGMIREEKEEFGEKYVKKIQGERGLLAICEHTKEIGEMVMNKEEIDFFVCSSWCKFDLYGADFGWGKPIWLCAAITTVKNVAVLMDTRDGLGIEVWLTLTKEEMTLLESNQEFLEFAAVNPSISLV